MEITYLGHSSFRLKGKTTSVVCDPFDEQIGFALPNSSADIVTISHDHPDHNNASGIKQASADKQLFVIQAPGEYEVQGVSIFGYPSFHDDSQGKDRGKNVIYTIIIDGVHVVHLGDLGHSLDESFIEKLGTVDVLLCPVGGLYTINAKQAVEIIQEIEPSYIIPMHYKTAKHDDEMFGKMDDLVNFWKEFGVTSEPVKSLTVNAGSLPEQTTLVVLGQ